MARRRTFTVTFKISAVEELEPLNAAAIRSHVHDLEWSGGCMSPDFALHTNKDIRITNVAVTELKPAVVAKAAKKEIA